MREVSQRDVKITVHYNRITVSSAISGMEVSFNGAGYVNRNTFVDLKSDTEYTIKVRFAESTNYLQSEELEFKVRTGIDISALVATINKFDKIDFSNIDEFESKVLVYMNSISESDKSLIDQAKCQYGYANNHNHNHGDNKFAKLARVDATRFLFDNFDDLYFVNSKFEDSEGKATFSADIRETLAFLGVANADNGKVSVVVDSQEKKLLSIDVSYDLLDLTSIVRFLLPSLWSAWKEAIL